MEEKDRSSWGVAIVEFRVQLSEPKTEEAEGKIKSKVSRKNKVIKSTS